jgi:hypothetical protein
VFGTSKRAAPCARMLSGEYSADESAKVFKKHFHWFTFFKTGQAKNTFCAIRVALFSFAHGRQ